MSPTAMRSRRGRLGWRIAVDLGGTWLRATGIDASTGRRRHARLPSPGLNGLPSALAGISRAWRLTPKRADVLIVASRGVWTTAERQRHARRLRSIARIVHVISDAEAAYLGALGDMPGVLLLAGTGSMALGRDRRGRWVRAGGLGPLLGDEGSAFWIGREWLKAESRDRFARARRVLGSPDPVSRIAAIAPDVLRRARRGSRAARRIVATAQSALAEIVLDTAKQLHLAPPIAVSWAGGLLDDARFRAAVWRALQRRGCSIRVQRPRESPLAAVVRRARSFALDDSSPQNATIMLTGDRRR